MLKEYTEDIVLRGPVRLATREYDGPGPAIVLMHGGGRDSRDWEDLAVRLRARYRVLTFDFCGHGQSSHCAGPWTFAEGLADLDAVIAHYRLDNPVIAGHSLGGIVATLYGAQHPAGRGAVNIDGIGVSVPAVFPGPDAEADRARVQAMIDVLASDLRPPDPPTLEDALATAVLGCDVFAVTATIRCPLLFIAAQEPDSGDALDEMTTTMQLWRAAVVAEFERLALRHPNIGWTTVPGDHLSILDAPDTLADRILRFLDTPARRT